MVSVDFRTRHESEVQPIDFVEFHHGTLAERLASGNARIAGRGVSSLGLPPLAIEVDGHVFTYALENGEVVVRSGDQGAETLAVLSREAFSDLVQDLRSTVGLVLENQVPVRRGGQRTFLEWEPVLRAMIDGRPVYEPGAISFRDRDGSPLDLTRRFSPDAPRDDMAHFLAEAGFLCIEGLFDPEEMARLEQDIERAVPSYAANDGRSWWARTSAGEHRLVRLQNFQEHSETTRRLLSDERYLSIGRITDDDHLRGQRTDGNAVEALIKPIGVVEGISDVSWHKDCSLGRHSYQCSGITAGISVTPSDRDSGQLCVVAGSHRASVQLKGLRDDLDLPRIGLPTRAGDVTVHLSCTLHMSIPPVSAERRVLYTGFGLPPRAGEEGLGRDAILRIREQAPHSVGKKGTIGDDELRTMNSYDTRGLR